MPNQTVIQVSIDLLVFVEVIPLVGMTDPRNAREKTSLPFVNLEPRTPIRPVLSLVFRCNICLGGAACSVNYLMQ